MCLPEDLIALSITTYLYIYKIWAIGCNVNVSQITNYRNEISFSVGNAAVISLYFT